MLLLPTSPRRPDRDVCAPDRPEALIREARQRARRRRLRVAAVVMLLAGIAVAGYALLAPGAPAVFTGTAGTPYANARAFSGHGELAFVSRGQLWVLDGSSGTLRHLRVPAGDTADFPTFSHDGRWLAYAVEPVDPNYRGSFELWIAHGDGSGAHRIPGVGLDELVGWSRRSDLIAVTTGRHLRSAPYGLPTAVRLVTSAGRVRTLLGAPPRPRGLVAIWHAAWSPNGKALAVQLAGGRSSAIETVPLAGGKPTVWLASDGSRPVPMVGVPGRVTGLIPQLAGWWPHWGVAFWVIDAGAVDSRDSTQLVVMRRPHARPRFIANTLSLGMSDELAPGPGGKLAVVASANNFGREFAAGKTVEACLPATARCLAVPGATAWTGPRDRAGEECPACRPAVPPPGRPGSGVSEDPQWSPDGTLLAYEKAPALNSSAWPNNAWFADHAVYVWNSATNATRRVGTVSGSALPTWSRDGRDLIFESRDGLWLMPIASGRAIEVVHPLYSQAAWNNKTSHLASVSYYGQIPWQSQFSWWSPPRHAVSAAHR